MQYLDAYTKIADEFRVRYWVGGLLTILCVVCVGWMLIGEVDDYMTTTTTPVLQVDKSNNKRLPINFDITLPHSSCYFTTIDVLDTTGEVNINIDATVQKTRLNVRQETLPSFVRYLRNKHKLHLPQRKGEDALDCPPCYEAEGVGPTCCYTCDDLRKVYRKIGKEIPRDAVQCTRDAQEQLARISQGEGCRINGTVWVNKVAGNFHIAPGTSEQHNLAHQHQSALDGRVAVNMTHVWNRLTFGDEFPNMPQPLGGRAKTDLHNNTMYQYFVQIVPMTYNAADGTRVKTHGYSVTEHERRGSSAPEDGVPGVFVLYDISPMEVIYEEHTGDFFHLLTGVCAIVGGMFTVFSLLDAFIFHSLTVISRHED